MSFQKAAGILQIILSFILVCLPITGLILIGVAESRITNLQTETLRGVNIPLSEILPNIFLIAQWSLIVILVIHSIIALSLILQGIVNIKEG